jgi:hypothetical protein
VGIAKYPEAIDDDGAGVGRGRNNVLSCELDSFGWICCCG